jgi:hypothetical protein
VHSPHDAPKRTLSRGDAIRVQYARLVAVKTPLSTYRALIARFVDGAISRDEFADAYFPRFKSEDDLQDSRIYEALNAVFVDLDCVTNPPPFEVTEAQLRKNLRVYLAQVDALIAEKR